MVHFQQGRAQCVKLCAPLIGFLLASFVARSLVEFSRQRRLQEYDITSRTTTIGLIGFVQFLIHARSIFSGYSRAFSVAKSLVEFSRAPNYVLLRTKVFASLLKSSNNLLTIRGHNDFEFRTCVRSCESCYAARGEVRKVPGQESSGRSS